MKASYWAKPSGYFSMDRKTVALLVNEAPSVSKLFQVITSQAFTRQIGVRQVGGGVQIFGEGSRPWGQYELARAAGLSINTIRRGLWRLSRLKLIRYAASKLGTIVEVLNYFRYKRPATGVHDQPFLTPRGDQRRSKVDTYRGVLKKDLKIITSIVDVPPPPEEKFLGREGAAMVRDLRMKIFGW